MPEPSRLTQADAERVITHIRMCCHLAAEAMADPSKMSDVSSEVGEATKFVLSLISHN